MNYYLPLTERDRKIMRNDMMPGRIFGLLAAGVALIGLIIMLPAYEGFRLWTLPLALLGSAVVGGLIWYAMNRKLLEALKAGYKKAVTVTLQRKEARSVFGPDRGKGPGTTMNNLVNTIGEGGREDDSTYFFVVDNKMYRTSKEMFDAASDDDPIEMHYTAYSNRFLGFYPHTK